MNVLSVEVKIDDIGLLQSVQKRGKDIHGLVFDRIFDHCAPLIKGALADLIDGSSAIHSLLKELLFEEKNTKLGEKLVLADLALSLRDLAHHELEPDHIDSFFDQLECSIT